MKNKGNTLSDSHKELIQETLILFATHRANLYTLADVFDVEIPKVDEFEGEDFITARLDGEKINFYDDFFDMYFGTDMFSEEELKNDSELKAGADIVKPIVESLKTNDYERLKEICSQIYAEQIKIRNSDFLENENLVSQLNEQTEKDYLITDFVTKHMFASSRKGRAEFLVNKSIRWADLKLAINDIIYCTIYKTISELKKKNIDVSSLEYMYSLQVPFSQYWFAVTSTTNESEKARCIRQILNDEFNSWPKYESDSIMILDCAAFIQEILFYNKYCYVKHEKYKKENFNIWNQLSGLAIGLGEIYTKYKNALPLDDNDIIKKIKKWEAFTSGKSPKYSNEDQRKIADALEQEYLKSKKPTDKSKKSDAYYSNSAEDTGYGHDTLREIWKKYYPERFK